MPQTRSNKAQTPINADTFNLTGDLATMAESLCVVIPVADRAEADNVATARAAAGFAVSDSRPLFVWNQASNSIEVKGTGAWRGGIRPFGHAGKSDGFTSGNLNPVPVTSQILRGGVTLNTNGLVAPIAGYYRLTGKLYSSGAPTGLVNFVLYINGTTNSGASAQWTKTQVDELQTASIVRLLAAGDRITIGCTQPASVYGGDGYNGTWMEIEYMDQW